MIKIKCWTEKDLVDDLFDSDEILTKFKQDVMWSWMKMSQSELCLFARRRGINMKIQYNMFHLYMWPTETKLN